MNLDLSSGGFAIVGAILGIWGLVAFVFYLWYLWALSKLFPYLGLPSSHGWIPVWNQWQLINRAGLPGWVVLLAVVPGLVVVGIVFSIMAVHRLNKEFGKDVSYTVLGAFLPPIWAMLLASHISDGMYAGASVYTGETAFPPLSPQRSASAWPEPVAPGEPRQAAPATPAAPSENPAWRGLPPVPPGALSGAPSAPAAPAAPPTPAAPPAPAHGPAQGGEQPSVPADAPAPRDPHELNDWGFSRTTEGNFERLAAEEIGERHAQPLGAPRPAEPFAWPGDTGDPRRDSAVDSAAAYAALPSALPSAGPSDAPGGRVSEPARVEVAEPQSEVSAAPPSAPEPPERATPSVPEAETPSIFDLDPVAPDTAARRDQVSQDPMPQDPASGPASGPAHTDVPAPDSAPAPVVAAAPPVPAASPRASVPSRPDDAHTRALELDGDALDDRTVVVSAPIRWGLELPGGDILELLGDDLIVGRKPERMAGADVLALPDPTRTVSKSHARLRFDGEAWTVEDLHSTNGLSAVDAADSLTPLAPGHIHPIPERMVLGTLEVRVRPLERGELL